MNAAKRDEAIKILSYYFRTLYVQTGLRWTPDNDAEIAVAVDNLIEALEVSP